MSDELELEVGERDGWTWAGLGVVGAAAAVLSFSALADLAWRCGITGTVATHIRLAWLLPLVLDVFAATAIRIWLRRRACDEAIRFARCCAWAAIGATVAGNAYHGYLVKAQSPTPASWWDALTGSPTPVPWIVVVIVSAVPPLALGALGVLVHLTGRPLELTGDPDRDDEADRPDRGGELTDERLVDLVAAWSAELGEVPKRERIRLRYRIGSPRADRIRTAVVARSDSDDSAGEGA